MKEQHENKMMTAEPVKKKYPKRGFGSMDKNRLREIASMGGKEAHRLGVGHRFTAEEAREAGRKGGTVRAARQAAKVEDDKGV